MFNGNGYVSSPLMILVDCTGNMFKSVNSVHVAVTITSKYELKEQIEKACRHVRYHFFIRETHF